MEYADAKRILVPKSSQRQLTLACLCRSKFLQLLLEVPDETGSFLSDDLVRSSCL